MYNKQLLSTKLIWFCAIATFIVFISTLIISDQYARANRAIKGTLDEIKSGQVSLATRIITVRYALDYLEDLSSEIDSLAMEASRLEQQANEAIAISTLSEDQVQALEHRLNKDTTIRDIAFLILGAVMGVMFEQIYVFLTTKRWQNTPKSSSDNATSQTP